MGARPRRKAPASKESAPRSAAAPGAGIVTAGSSLRAGVSAAKETPEKIINLLYINFGNTDIIIPMISFLLALAVVGGAEPLKPLKILSGDSRAVNARFVTVGGRDSVGVWDMRQPKQLALIEFPDLKTSNDKDYANLWPLDISADGRWLLMSLQKIHWNGRPGPDSTTGSAELLLLSVAEQRVVRTLARLPKETCVPEGIQPWCPSFASARFSPDASKILYRTDDDYSWSKTDESQPSTFSIGWTDTRAREKEVLSVIDLSGRVSQRQAFSGVWDETQKPLQWVFTPPKSDAGFLADGRAALLLADDAGCQVKTLDGARVSLLDNCSGESQPRFLSGLVRSTADAYAAWDPVSGALKYKLPLTPNGSTIVPSDDLSAVVEISFTKPSATASVKVTDAASGRVIVKRDIEMPASDVDIAEAGFSRADGRLVLCGVDYRPADGYHTYRAVYQLGGESPPSLAVAAPSPSQEDIDAPPPSKTKTDPDAYAVVIGIEKYRQEGIPAVDYASHDARTVYSYLTQSMGYDPKNVALLIDDKATKTDLEKNLKSWLANRVDAKSRVFIYYAGHGAPNPATGEGYLMPYEADPNYLADTAFPLSELYAAVSKLPTKDVSIVLDACFSGQGARSLIAKGARPLVTVQKQKTPDNALVLAAAQASQISTSDPDRRHGLLTSYLLEGLHGAADARGDGKITAEELFAYVKPAVERAARLQNIEQIPSLSGASGPEPWIVLEK